MSVKVVYEDIAVGSAAAASVTASSAMDIYKAGEWAVQDGKYTKANQDTAYSLAEYPQAWDVEE